MIDNLVPSFILQQLAAGESNGRFPTIALFVDIHGFTPLTSSLMVHGKAGAEQIADALATVFDPMVKIVYQHGGFVAGFAGDSFKSLFPLTETDNSQTIHRAVSAAWHIHAHMSKQALYQTSFGTFEFGVKVTVADGDVEWGVWQTAVTPDNPLDQEYAYYFDGSALDRCLMMDNFADAGDVLLSNSVHAALANRQIEAEEGAGYWRLRQMRRRKMETAVSANLKNHHSVQAHCLPRATQNLANHFYPAALMPDLRGEFRQIVTLFINLKTMPDIAKGDDPFPSFFFNLLDKYDGYLCRIGRIGGQDDGATLLLFWGAPNSNEDDGLRAVRFAAELRRETNIPLRLGITMNLAYAGFMGTKWRDEYTCHGIYVNLAARQMTLGNWGDILLDEEMADAADEQFDVIHKGDFELKGFQEKRPIYQLEKQQLQTAVSIYQGKLIGREAELTQLQHAIQPIFEGKFSGTVTVLGEAGIGKSRLIHTFLIGKQSSSRQSLLCQTDAILHRPLNPFRQMLRRVFDQNNALSDAENRLRFDEKLKELSGRKGVQGEREEELARTANFLAALLNPHWADAFYEQLEPKLRFENTLIALKSILILLCQQQPLILQIEDAQWLDEDSATFLNRLTHNIENVPLAIILSTRSALPDTLFPSKSLFPQKEIWLNPLPANAISEMATALLKESISPHLSKLLHKRTDGNPFFIEQLLLHWQENEELRVSKSGLTVTKASQAMPFDVRTLLTARLDRLPPAVREVVQTAAVLGHRFESSILTHMLRYETGTLEKIESAENASIWTALTPLGGQALTPSKGRAISPNYQFNQPLLRDVAYEMQLQSRLRRLHFDAAEAIMQHHAVDLTSYYDDIATHYDHAETAPQAAMWYKLAGKQAMRQYANKQAEAMLSRALALTSQTNQQQRFQLLLLQEQLYNTQGKRKEQTTILDQLDTVAATFGGGSRQAIDYKSEVALRRSVYASTLSDYKTGVTYAETAVQLSDMIDDIPQLAEAYLAWGQALWPQSDYANANEKLQKALALAIQAKSRQTEAYALRNLGVVADFEGHYSEAKLYHEQAIQIFRDLNHLEGISGILNNLGMTALKRGNYIDARQFLKHALKKYRTMGHRSGESLSLANLGFVFSLQGAYEEAKQYYEQALAIFIEVGDVWSQGMAYGHLGLTAENQGDYTLALQNHEQSRTLFKQVKYEQGEGMVLAAMGSVLRRLGKYGEALTAVNAAMSLNKKFKAQRGFAQNLMSLSLLAHLNGNNEQAISYGEEALQIAEEIGERQVQAYALTNLAHARVELGQLDQANKQYRAALTLRHALGNQVLTMDATAGLARLLFLQSDLSAAKKQVDLIFDFLKENDLGGADQPGRIYLTCVQILQAIDDPLAQTMLTNGQQFLIEIAAKVDCTADKLSFLEQVAANQELLLDNDNI